MTQAIILAAGKGERLMPLTRNKPKCCIEFNNKSLLQYQVDTLKKENITKITIVAGYMFNEVSKYGLNTIINKDYETSNMVKSLFYDDLFFQNLDEDLIISYGDIIYEHKNLRNLIKSEPEISIMIDTNWLNLWNIRMENPLNDAESLIMDENNFITNIGMKAISYDQIQGQYTGLLKVKKNKIKQIYEYYKSINDGSLDNIYMTEFIQLLINNGHKISASIVKGGWLEFDTINDLNIYEELLSYNKLNNFFKF